MSEPILRVTDVSKTFGGLQALDNVSFWCLPKEIVGLIGPNGAGKTTLFNVVSGYLKPTRGEVVYESANVTGLPPYKLAALGVGRTFQVVKPFSGLSVLENVTIASLLRHPKLKNAQRKAWDVLEFTGLAIGRGLMQEPKIAMFDEPSLGLAPILVHEIFQAIQDLHRSGLTIFLVEQNAHHALRLSDYCYVIENGRVVKQGDSKVLENDPGVREAYLGF